MEILLVDDNDEMRAVLEELLETGGHRITSVASARDALACLEERHFDRLVTDFDMPETDGLALAAAARLEYPRLPALLVTSHPEAPERAKAMGIEVLPKPVEAQRLLAAVETARAPRPVYARPDSADPASAKAPPAVVVPGETRPPEMMRRRPPHRRMPYWPPAMAASLVVAGILAFSLVDRAPELPDPPATSVVRGTAIELLDPMGPLAAPPTSLRWRAIREATRYRVVFERVDGRVVFQHTLESPTDETGISSVEVSAELAASLEPMVVYTWWVEALDSEGASLARSPRERLRILAEPSLPSIGDPR